MAATYTKPSKVPRWADTTANINEPSEGEKDIGFPLSGLAESDKTNWLLNATGDWFQWVNERFFDGYPASPDPDNFYIMKPGSTTEIVFGYNDSIQQIVTDFSFVPGDTDLSMGLVTADWLKVYTKELRVSRWPICGYKLASAITIAAQTEVSVLPDTGDTEYVADGVSCDSNRYLTVSSNMPTGTYSLKGVWYVGSGEPDASIYFRVYIDSGSGFVAQDGAGVTEEMEISVKAIGSALYLVVPAICNWTLNLSAGDIVDIRAYQSVAGAAAQVTSSSHIRCQLEKPEYA